VVGKTDSCRPHNGWLPHNSLRILPDVFVMPDPSRNTQDGSGSFSGELDHCFIFRTNLGRSVKKAHVNGLAEDVSLNFFHDPRAGFESISAGLDVELSVQSK